MALVQSAHGDSRVWSQKRVDDAMDVESELRILFSNYLRTPRRTNPVYNILPEILMLKLHGVRERRDKTWYDTHVMEPGQSRRFFLDTEPGKLFKTNIEVPGCFAFDQTYVALALGARCIGKTRGEEDLLLDHLRIQCIIGDKPYSDHFIRPLIVPVHQSFHVRVEASPALPETVPVRIHIFGLLTRDVA